MPGWQASHERRSQKGDVIGPETGQTSAPEPLRIGAPEASSRASTRFCSCCSDLSCSRISESDGAPGETASPFPPALPLPDGGTSVADSVCTTTWLGAPTDGP